MISIRYKLKWEALWKEDATLEEVGEAERAEYINEALIEISSKMKRKHKQKQMGSYKLLEFENEHVLVEYPELKSPADSEKPITDAELKELSL